MQTEACGNMQGREKEVSEGAVRVELIALPRKYLRVFLPTVSAERRVLQSKEGQSSPPDTGHVNHPPVLSSCCSSAHTLQESLQEVMVVSAGRWAENGNPHFTLHRSQQPTAFLTFRSC